MRNHALGPCYTEVRVWKKSFVNSMALLVCIPAFQTEYKRLVKLTYKKQFDVLRLLWMPKPFLLAITAGCMIHTFDFPIRLFPDRLCDIKPSVPGPGPQIYLHMAYFLSRRQGGLASLSFGLDLSPKICLHIGLLFLGRNSTSPWLNTLGYYLPRPSILTKS